MADAAVSFLLENLQQVIVREGALLSGVEEKIGWITTEFQVMVPIQESVEAQHQLTEDEKKCVKKTRELIRRADDVIDTYAKKSRMSKMAGVYKKPIYLIERRGLSMEMDSLKDEIIQLRQGWRSVVFAERLEDLATTSSWASPAMATLDSLADHDQDGDHIHTPLKWVRDELAPLHRFLQQIHDHEQTSLMVFGERQKIWIQELRDIFNFVDQSWSSKLPEVLESEVRDKILQLYRIYYTYGFGEILIKSDAAGSSSTSFIYPRIRMNSPVHETCCHTVTYLSLLMPEGPILETLKVDLKLINALEEDIRTMGEVDDRVKVWLRQVRETCVDIAALIELISSEINNPQTRKCFDISALMELISGENGTPPAIREPTEISIIRYEIRDIGVRRMTYGIGRALGERDVMMPVDHPVLAHGTFFEEPDIPTHEIRRRVKSVRKDLELMQVVLKDVGSMEEKLDARLRVWMEGMQYVAHQANAVAELELELDTTSTNRALLFLRQLVGPYCSSLLRNEEARISRIYNHILVLSRWKHTYDIPYIKSRARQTIRESTRYQPMDIDYEEELMRTEIKLIEAFSSDAIEMGGLDRTSQVWAEEMGKIAELAEKYAPGYGESKTVIIAEYAMKIANYGGPKAAFLPDQVKDKIGHLSQVRIAYGIELAKRLPPEAVQQIKSKLLMNHRQTPCILPVLGMRYAYKEAFQDLTTAMKQHFDWHAWIYVPTDIGAGSILEYMTERITEQEKAQFLEEEPTSFSTQKELMLEMLMRRKCLIVLYEIHDIQVWTFLIQALQEVSTGSRVVLISTEDTYSLLDSTYSTMCHTPVRLIHPNSGMDGDNSSTVPSYLSQCLYYFLLFPADFNVPVRRLIVLWVIEGLVHSKENENKSAENVAEDYLEQLIGHGMVRITNQKLNGKPKYCQLIDGQRRILLEAANQAGFFKDANGIISRLVDHHDIIDNSCFIKIHGNPKSSASVPDQQNNIVSFLSFDTTDGSKPGQEIGAFLRKCILAGCFKWLRMLDLERVFRPKLPKELSKLILLRYLGLRWTYLEVLPEYVSNCLSLQVLDVKHTYISILPKSIWKMQYLRHLYLSEIYRTRFSNRPHKVSLNNLQTLWGAFIDEDTAIEGGLDTATNIRKLGLSCRSSSAKISEQLKVVAKWISNLNSLETLRLKSRDEHGEHSDLHLETLENNQSLSTIYLLGKLQPSVVERFPKEKLIEITLSGSELAADPMKYLQYLPELLILRLLYKSVVDTKMHCSKDGFAKLKILCIWKLENLEEWEVEEGAMPCLEDLDIRSCGKLNRLPDALQHCEKLKKFSLTCKAELLDNKKQQQPQLWAKLENVCEFYEQAEEA